MLQAARADEEVLLPSGEKFDRQIALTGKANTGDPGLVVELQKSFGEIIRDEDYAAAAASRVGADSGVQDAVVFGRNEPALHHDHDTYREALGLPPLPLLEAWAWALGRFVPDVSRMG